MPLDFGIKEIENVIIRSQFSLKIGNKTYQPNEPILYLDSLQIANVDEDTIRRESTGSYGETLVYWDNVNEVHFNCIKGVISKIGMALLANSPLISTVENIIIPYQEKLQRDVNSQLVLKYTPTDSIFIYDIDTNLQVTAYTIENNVITLPNTEEGINYSVYYNFLYSGSSDSFYIGQRLLSGYLKIDGKIRVKDDKDALIKTGIIEFPKIRLMSDLSLRLGSNTTGRLYNFEFAAYPSEVKGKKCVYKITILDRDLDSDY